MFNKRIATGLMSIAGAFAIAGGATFAYFTDTAESANNQFTAGTLEISIDENETHQPADPISNWQPGEERFVRFDVVNTGTLPVHLRGGANGVWGSGNNPDLNPDVVKVVKAEYWNQANNTWRVIESNGNGVSNILHYAPGNNVASLQELAPGSREQFRLTVKLADEAGDVYQGKTFNAKVQVEAKQTNAPAF